MITNINKFSLIEALNNSKGKSSLGLLFGFLYGIAALIMYAIATYMVMKGIVGYDQVYMYAGVLTTASGTLIGTRYWKKDKDININNEQI